MRLLASGFASSAFFLTLAAALVLALAPDPARAADADRAAIVVTQAVGVGPLADRLGNLAVDKVAAGPLLTMGPGEAARLLRERAGPDPLRCGSDAACLGEIGRLLEVRWLISVGIGRFGEMFGLEVSSLDLGLASDAKPRTATSTFAAPGPDWEEALSDALGRVLPAALLLPPAQVELRTNVDGAELLVDGSLHGTTPLAAPLRLPEGSYRLELRKEGYSISRSEVQLASGAQQLVELLLAPISAPASTSSLRSWTYASGGTSMAALLAAAYFHAGASSDMDSARSRKVAGKPFADERSDALSGIQSARILYGVAGAAAISALTLYLLDAEPAKGSPPQERGRSFHPRSAREGSFAVAPPPAPREFVISSQALTPAASTSR